MTYPYWPNKPFANLHLNDLGCIFCFYCAPFPLLFQLKNEACRWKIIIGSPVPPSWTPLSFANVTKMDMVGTVFTSYLGLKVS